MEHHSLAGLFADQTRETTIPHLPAERLRKIPFSFPPREEQQAIADEIQALTKALAFLDKHAMALTNLLSALVDEIGGGMIQ
jgi:restriction endonuclease S subunit